MFLEHLEIFGFKSFRERTVFEFDEGITAIVGPNGCGKSNVAEAIRWILGEQSPSNLRARTFEDIIFNGCEGSPPLGLAEGHLTFDNTKKILPIDFDKVTISRRTFRSGENEYFINKTPCRWKDIIELFLDTGIGRHSYSLMHQDRVDFILKSKPIERRTIFEELAGIGKYKARREETLRKLEGILNDISRIEDILGEIKHQLSSLYREKKRAEQYNELKRKIQELEISLGCREYKKFTSSYENKSSLLKKEKTLLHRLRQKKVLLEEKIHKWKEETKRQRTTLSLSREETYRLTLVIQSISEELIRKEERYHYLSKEKKRLTEEKELVSKKIEEERLKREKLIKEKKDITRKLEEERENLREKEKELISLEKKRQSSLSTLENLKEKMIDILASMAKIRSKISSLREAEREVLVRREKIKAEIEDLSKGMEKKRYLFDELKERLSSLEDEKKKLLERISSFEEEIKKKERILSEMGATVEFLKGEEKSLEKEISTIVRLEEEMAGYNSGVRYILAKKDELEGIEGVVGELLDVAPQYEMAIEVALGSNLQAIITKDIKSALLAIKELKKNKKERVIFLPLDLIQEPPSSPPPFNINTVGRAIDFVRYPPPYKKLFSYLLGNVYIVNSLEGLKEILSDKIEGHLKFVTPSGDLLETKGLVSGGEKREVFSLIGRKRKIQSLKEKLIKVKEKVSNLHFQKEKLSKEVDILVGDLLKTKEKAENLKSSFLLEEAKFEQLNRELSLNEERIKNLKREDKEKGDEILTIKKEISSLIHSQKELKEKSLKEREAIEKLGYEVNEYEGLAKKLTLQVTQSKVKVGTLAERLSSIGEEILKIHTLYEREIEAHKKLGEELQKVCLESKRIKKELLDLEKKKRESISKREESKKKEEEIYLFCKRIEDEINVSERELIATDEEIEHRIQKIHELEVEASRLKVKMEDIVLDLSKKYGLEVEEITSWNGEKIEAEEEPSLEELKKKLLRMGEINLMAPKEYKSVKRRFDLMNQQKEDLLRAERDLRKIIKEIDKVSKELFLKTFEEIRSNFQKIFEELFEGGKVDLVMTTEDPLTAGVEIVVEPPGKRLQNISLLSGGERALTAIALLFGMFMTKPSPFCVLDEIDAALDDANIIRYTRLLKKFSKGSQFLIITHNKKTMEVSDVLYGITMEKPGISKLISVRWKEGAVS